MPMPTEFAKQIESLQRKSAAAAEASSLSGVEHRDWMLPYYDSTHGRRIEDPGFLKEAVARGMMTELYLHVLQRDQVAELSGSAGELVAYKSGIDYLGAMERALQARHASRTRARAWAAARRGGQGDATYGVFAAVLNELNSVLGAGGPDEAPPPPP